MKQPVTRLRARWNDLKKERSSYDAHYQDLSDYLMPRSLRLNTSRTGLGTKMNEKIFNNTAVRAKRTLGSGLQAGITSPARRWYRLTTPNPRNVEEAGVRDYLEESEQRMYTLLAQSNAYNALGVLYEDLITFSTGVMLVEDDDKDGIRCHNIPPGSYVLTTNQQRRVNGIMREIAMTVENIVNTFGLENCSTAIRHAWNAQDYDSRFTVINAIMPNESYIAGKLGPVGMEYASYWFEEAPDTEAKFLKVGGYHEFPVMAPRWNVVGVDTYGSDGPGMEALGDIKALQRIERKKLNAYDKIVDPPMKGPTALKTGRASLLSGDITYVDETGTGSAFSPAHVVDTRAIQIEALIEQHESRINATFFADLFALITQRPYNKTAREVDELHEEKMLQLGPVLERLQDELLDPFIDRVFGIMARRGMLPTPPRRLVEDGGELRVEYISILSQAQKMLGTIAIERLIGFVTSASQFVPDIVDKVDWDQTVDEIGDLLGVPTDIIRSDDDVLQLREQKAAAQQAQQAAQMAPAMRDMAAASKDMAELGDTEAIERTIQESTGVIP